MEEELLKEIQQPLIRWYQGHARVLPWREDPTPYHVWVSEIMLQQTRVEAVKSYYERFMNVLPDIPALAECPGDQLMKLWEGLGYYNRARNMQKTARIVMENYEGVLPDSYEDLLTLPGIGSYTAGAIASIAYGHALPAVDGNVLRVLSRVTENRGDIAKQSVKREVEKALSHVMPQDCPGLFNQALMEIGALICVPNSFPDCTSCPLSKLCLANRDKEQMMFPVRSARKARRIEKRTVLVIRDSAHAALRRRPSNGLLAGLFELPNLERHISQKEALTFVAGLGFSPIRIQPLKEAKHIFTHVEWHMIGYLVLVEDQDFPRVPPKDGGIFFPPAEEIPRSYPIPAAFSSYAQTILKNFPLSSL